MKSLKTESLEQMQQEWLSFTKNKKEWFIARVKTYAKNVTAEKFNIADCIYEALEEARRNKDSLQLDFAGFVAASVYDFPAPLAHYKSLHYESLVKFNQDLLSIRQCHISDEESIDALIGSAKDSLLSIATICLNQDVLLMWFDEPVEFPMMAMDSLDWLEVHLNNSDDPSSFLSKDILGDDPFELCVAHQQLERDYNSGGWLQARPSNQRRYESTDVQLHRMDFRYVSDRMSEEAQAIYNRLEVQYSLVQEVTPAL